MNENVKKVLEEAPAAKEKKTVVKETEAENYIYIGPNRLADGLKCRTVYRGYPKGVVEGAAVKYANIARLFVPVIALAKAMADVEKAGTPLHLAYQEVQRSE